MIRAIGLLAATLSALALGCGGEAPPGSESGTPGERLDTLADGSIRVPDASGDTLVLAAPPARIVALVPAVNQILVELGVADRIVGRTDYDTLTVLAELPSVGGGIGANLETLAVLRPDVVIGFHGPSDAATRRRLADLGIPHLGVRPDRIGDVRTIIARMGILTGRTATADSLIAVFDAELEAVRSAVADLPVPSAAFLLGGDPPLVAGPGTFVDELLSLGGARNAFDDLGDLYPPVSPETLRSREIDLILLTEGARVDARILEGRRVERVPGWILVPGPAVTRAAALVARAVHPGITIPPARPPLGNEADSSTGSRPR